MAFDIPVCTEKDNTKRVLQEALDFSRKCKAKTLIVFDFDELLTFYHTSRALTHITASKTIRDAIVREFGDHGWETLLILSNLKIGLSKKEYLNAMKKGKRFLRLRPQAIALIRALAKKKGVEMITLSSASYFIQTEVFRGHNLLVTSFACKLAFHNDRVIGSKVIYQEEDKARFLRELKRRKKFRHIFVLGHSKSDARMLKEGIGISVNGDVAADKAAKFRVKNLKEAQKLILSKL